MTLLYDFKGVWAELEVFAYCGFCATKWLNIATCIHPMEVFTECKFISQWKKKIGDSSWHPRDRGCPFNMGSAWYRFHCKTIIIVLLAIAFVAGIKWGGGGVNREWGGRGWRVGVVTQKCGPNRLWRMRTFLTLTFDSHIYSLRYKVVFDIIIRLLLLKPRD